MEEKEANAGGQFEFKVGDRVIYAPEVFGVKYPEKRVRIIARTTEPALGKTYLIRYQNGRNGGYTPEHQLRRVK